MSVTIISSWSDKPGAIEQFLTSEGLFVRCSSKMLSKRVGLLLIGFRVKSLHISSSLRQWLGPLDVWRTQSISRQLKSPPRISVLSTCRFVSVASSSISGLSPADGGGAIKAANIEVRLVGAHNLHPDLFVIFDMWCVYRGTADSLTNCDQDTTSVKRSITAKTVRSELFRHYFLIRHTGYDFGF